MPERSCCDMHNEHCEPPGDLCCNDCTEADHGLFPPKPHDCVLERPAVVQFENDRATGQIRFRVVDDA